jgi:poly-gamma-glutamate synthesis protein (capsule biosynthesis protein)
MKAEESDLKALLMAVENTRKKADFVVVSIHWGPQWQPMVLDYQSEIAHTLIDHGVDIIMGHGPHVLQGIEVYKKRYVFYSLGHFVFHTNQPRMTTMLPEMPNNIPMKRAVADPVRWRLNETAIGKVVLSDSEIKRVEIIPVILDRNGSPQVCDNDAAMSILNDLAVFSRYLDTRVTIKENKGIIEV